MASAGSNVRLSLVGLTGTTAEILYTIDTTGRYEDGYLIVFNENNTEVSRTSSFRAYGNSSGSQNVTGIASGHLYTVKFYSSDLGVYSESTVEIDLRSGDPAYAVSSSSTATSVNIIVSPISSATMEADGTVVVESVSDGIKDSIGYKSSDSSASIMLVGLDQNTEYTFSVTYYDPGLATTTVRTVTIDTAELDPKIVPKLYGEVENETQLVDRMYGEVGNEAQRVNKLYGPGEKTVFDDLQLKGDTFQQTYSGKNLWSFNTGTFTNNSGVNQTVTKTDNSLVLTADTTTGAQFISWITPEMDTTKTYTISGKAKKVVKGTDGQPYIRVGCSYSDDGTTWSSQTSFYNIIDPTQGQEYSFSYTLPLNHKYYRLRCYNNASTPVTVGEQTTYYDLQLESGSTATSFEPYVGGTASPNPDYPQAINVVTGAQMVKVAGKNLFNGILELGIINGNTGQDQPNNNFVRSKDYIQVGESTIYTISSTNTSVTNILVYEYKADHSYNMASNRSVGNGGSFMTNSGTKYLRFRPGLQSTDTSMQFQLEKNSSPTTYQPYQSQSYTIDLGSTELCKIGDYQDYIYKSGDDWYVRKEINKLELDGSSDESWSVSNTGTSSFYYLARPIPDGDISANITTPGGLISNYGTAAAVGNSGTTQGIMAVYSTGKSYIRVRYGTEMALNDWKTKLSGSPMTVYYALATPTDTKITDNTLIGELETIRKGALGEETTVQVEGDLPVVLDYDSISSYAKLIHIDRKKIPIFGEVTYYDSNNRLVTEVLKSQAEVNSFAGVSSNWSGTANGVTIPNGSIRSIRLYSLTTSIPEWFLSSCDNMTNVDMAGASITSIPNRFMVGCTSITDGNSVVLPSSLTSIGDNFMYGCNGLTSAPAFSDSLTSIGRTFMNDCTNMTIVVFPASLTSIGQEMLSVCDRLESVYVGNLSADITAADSSGAYSFSVLTSGASAYVNGIKILGDSSVIDGWLTKFPNRNSTPFRKLTTSSVSAISIMADASGSLTIRNKWTTPILVQNITKETEPVSIEADRTITLSVDTNDMVTIVESSIGSTFRYWYQTYNLAPLATGVNCRIIAMPSMDKFTIDSNGTIAGNGFFKYFNYSGSIISLPAGSFDISNITTVGDYFFAGFNYQGMLASLPNGSFDTSNITTIGDYFFNGFNNRGAIASLPSGSFNISNITIANNYFFMSFNYGGELTHLPVGSFDTSNITTVGDFFFAGFNARVLGSPSIIGKLASLPIGSFNTSNITTTGNNFFFQFNFGGCLQKSTSSYNTNFINSSSYSVDAYYGTGSSGSTTATSISSRGKFYYYQI